MLAPPPQKALSILVFEWLNSGGVRNEHRNYSAVEHSMLEQGMQMLAAISTDFIKAGHKVVMPLEERSWDAIPDQLNLKKLNVSRSVVLKDLLLQLANEVDFVIVIAPETDSILPDCLDWLSPVKHKLLNPDAEFTKLTSDKNRMFKHLEKIGFNKFPTGSDYQHYLDEVNFFAVWPLPLVLKPSDGAGGDEVHFIFDWADCEISLSRPSDFYRIEQYVKGTPVSVSAICGTQGCDLLSPTIQVFKEGIEPGVHYDHAQYPIDEPLTQKAIELATEVVAALPKTQGYIGLDMVIGENSEGEPDAWLIEVNPRLTTSYLKLREIYSENLAQRMLDRATGSVNSKLKLKPV